MFNHHYRTQPVFFMKRWEIQTTRISFLWLDSDVQVGLWCWPLTTWTKQMCWVTALPSWRAASLFVQDPLSSSSRNTVSKWLHSSLVHITDFWFLKFDLMTSCLGTGYHLIVIRRSTCDVEALTERLQSHIADVKLEVSPHYAQPGYDRQT